MGASNVASPTRPHGNIFLDQPPDLSKLEYIIDYMQQKNFGAWLVQETWEEGDEYNIDIGGYCVFRHNSMHGNNCRQPLFQRCCHHPLSNILHCLESSSFPPILWPPIPKMMLKAASCVLMSNLTSLMLKEKRSTGNHCPWPWSQYTSPVTIPDMINYAWC